MMQFALTVRFAQPMQYYRKSQQLIKSYAFGLTISLTGFLVNHILLSLERCFALFVGCQSERRVCLRLAFLQCESGA